MSEQSVEPDERCSVVARDLAGVVDGLAPLSIDMYIPAFSSIGSDLHVLSSSVQLTLASFFGGFALGCPRWGRSSIVWVARSRWWWVLLCTFLRPCRALARSVEVLAVLRAFRRSPERSLWVVLRAVVRDVAMRTPPVKMFSRLMLVMGVAPIVAPLLGGCLLSLSGWPSIFMRSRSVV
ncbi:MAG: MFS transporter [Polyangiaceae bacterium]